MKDGFVKVAAVTPQIKVADPAFNAEQAIAAARGAAKAGAKLVVLPELCLTGYTCGDLFYQEALLSAALSGLKRFKEETAELDALFFVGLPVRVGGLLYNCAAAVARGRVLGLVPKTFLPNYNEFYERRHFAPAPPENGTCDLFGEPVPFGSKLLFAADAPVGLTVAAEICEDLWTADPPSVHHAVNGATVIVNLSASDETVGKAEYRRNLVAMQSARLVAGYVYADAGEGESSTDMVFAGHNLVAENGRILAETPLFLNGSAVSEIDVSALLTERSKLANYAYARDRGYCTVRFSLEETKTQLTREYARLPFVPRGERELGERAELILTMQAAGLKKRLLSANAKKLVIGLSGGLDSTLALLVSVRALHAAERPLTDLVGVTMPCFGTTDRTLNNTVRLSRALKITLKKIDIAKSVTRHLKEIGHDLALHDVTYENAQARERTQVLMDIANQEGGLVVGTGDLSELALGWATYNGDHMSMYAVNAGVPKTLVRYLVRHEAMRGKPKLRGILTDILDTPVSPELLPAKDGEIAQKTEEIVGPYELHDFFLYHAVRMGFSPKKVYRLAVRAFDGEYSAETVYRWLKTFYSRFFAQQFKRSCLPDGVKVGSVTLSPRGDWRMPSDASRAAWLAELEEIAPAAGQNPASAR